MPSSASRTFTHSLSPRVSLPFFLSVSASFFGSRLISFPQPAVSISPAERAPPTPESYASFLRLFLSRCRTQWRATTSRSLCLSAPNWPGAAEGPRGRCRAGAGAVLFPPRCSDHWTKVEPAGFGSRTHLLPVKGNATPGIRPRLCAGLTQRELVRSRAGADGGACDRLMRREKKETG